MGYFSSPEEVDRYIGEMFRVAANDPGSLRANTRSHDRSPAIEIASHDRNSGVCS